MDVTRESINALVGAAIEDFNMENKRENRISSVPETALFGKEGTLDSLGLVNLLVLVQECIEDELDVSVVLADERAVSQEKSPFRTVESLSEYTYGLVSEAVAY